MKHRWLARALVAALHAAVLLALWLYRPAGLHEAAERRLTTVRLIAAAPRRATEPAPAPSLREPRDIKQQRLEPPPLPIDAAPTSPTPGTPAAPATATTASPSPLPPEPGRSTLRLTLPPGYAASSAQARNPALTDPRSNTARLTLEDRIANAIGGDGWVEERTSDYRSEVVGAQGDRRTVLRRGNTCVEVFRSRIADQDPFNGSVAPRAVGMVGKAYPCR